MKWKSIVASVLLLAMVGVVALNLALDSPGIPDTRAAPGNPLEIKVNFDVTEPSSAETQGFEYAGSMQTGLMSDVWHNGSENLGYGKPGWYEDWHWENGGTTMPLLTGEIPTGNSGDPVSGEPKVFAGHIVDSLTLPIDWQTKLAPEQTAKINAALSSGRKVLVYLTNAKMSDGTAFEFAGAVEGAADESVVHGDIYSLSVKFKPKLNLGNSRTLTVDGELSRTPHAFFEGMYPYSTGMLAVYPRNPGKYLTTANSLGTVEIAGQGHPGEGRVALSDIGITYDTSSYLTWQTLSGVGLLPSGKSYDIYNNGKTTMSADSIQINANTAGGGHGIFDGGGFGMSFTFQLSAYFFVESDTTTYELKVEKELTGLGADLSKPFDFRVEFTDETGTVDMSGITSDRFSGAGSRWSGTLKHGEVATISGIPAGLKYVVLEATPQAPYSMGGAVGDSASGVMDEDKHVTVVNVYTPPIIETHTPPPSETPGTPGGTTPPHSSGGTVLQRLEWSNELVGFSEVKEGTWATSRDTEQYEAMAGTPTTRSLYVSAGGTPIHLYLRAELVRDEYSVDFFGRDLHVCGHNSCTEHGAGPCETIVIGRDSCDIVQHA